MKKCSNSGIQGFKHVGGHPLLYKLLSFQNVGITNNAGITTHMLG
jgi:hypothetical protein